MLGIYKKRKNVLSKFHVINNMAENKTCKVCKHPMKMHKDIADSQGRKDGKHLACLAPAKKQNDFLVKSFGGVLSCSCNTKEILSESLA